VLAKWVATADHLSGGPSRERRVRELEAQEGLVGQTAAL
jgi:hypothetical protein